MTKGAKRLLRISLAVLLHPGLGILPTVSVWADNSALRALEQLTHSLAGLAKPKASPVDAVALEIARRLGETEVRSLSEIFNGRIIKTVFNGDAGSGRWQKDILGKPWLDSSAAVLGFDLAKPIIYPVLTRRGPKFGANPEQDWKDIVVLTDFNDSRFPKPGTIDLAHVAFLDMNFGPWDRRLRGYMDIVREGGFFLIAHSHSYDISVNRRVRDEIARIFLISNKWDLIAIFDDPQADRAPADYPTTEWWGKFSENQSDPIIQRYAARGQRLNNFLLVFQKKRLN